MTLRRIGAVAVTMTAILFLATAIPQAQQTDGIKWLKYDEGVKLAAKTNKPMIIDFYTEWCGWCKKMDKTTYTDPQIIQYINKVFIPIKLNPELKEQYNIAGGPTDARSVGRSFGVSSYPQTWFVEPNGKKIDKWPGFAPADKFLIVLKYIGDGIYKNQSWTEYQKVKASTE